MAAKLATINNGETADNFYYWLQENTEIETLQGFTVERNDANAVQMLRFGSTVHNFDYKYIWNERGVMNDWIRGMIERGWS